MSHHDVAIRTEVQPGDIGAIVRMHGLLYAKEYGFDSTFEAYVAEPLAKFVLAPSPRNRIWIAERREEIVGCIAIVECASNVAQLRWYLVDPSMRGAELGKDLLNRSLEFCKVQRFKSVILWTVSSLKKAADLYRSVGFQKVESNAVHIWGVDIFEEMYELRVISRD